MSPASICDPVVVDRDLGRRCRMDRSREEGRLEGDVHLDVDVRGCERRDGDGRCDEERCVPLLGHEPDERAGNFIAALLAGGQVRQDRERDDSHVDRDDGGGNRGRESESEQDVDPHPPGAGPQQQIGATEAEKPEHGSNGEDDQDVHGVTAPSRGRQGPARRPAPARRTRLGPRSGRSGGRRRSRPARPVARPARPVARPVRPVPRPVWPAPRPLRPVPRLVRPAVCSSGELSGV